MVVRSKTTNPDVEGEYGPLEKLSRGGLGRGMVTFAHPFPLVNTGMAEMLTRGALGAYNFTRSSSARKRLRPGYGESLRKKKMDQIPSTKVPFH